MKITATGLMHKRRPRTILDREIKKSRQSNKQTWDVNRDTGDITFFWYELSLDIRGNVLFRAELSREEIVRLFVSSMSDVPLEEAVRLLAESGKKPTIRARAANLRSPTVARETSESVAAAA